MPGTIEVSLLEAVDLPEEATAGNSVSIKVSIGKREFQTMPIEMIGNKTAAWKSDFSFPVLNLRDNLKVALLDNKGQQISCNEIETPSIVEKSLRDEFLSLKGGGQIHLRMRFVLTEEERRRIEAMRAAAVKRREEEALKKNLGNQSLNVGEGGGKSVLTTNVSTNHTSLRENSETERESSDFVKRAESIHTNSAIESLVSGNAGLDKKVKESNDAAQRETYLNVPSLANAETKQTIEQVKEDLSLDTENRVAVDSISSVQSLQTVPTIEYNVNNVTVGEESFHKRFSIENLVPNNSGLDDRRETENTLKSENSSNPAQRESFLNAPSSAIQMDYLNAETEQILEQVKEDLALDTESRAVDSVSSVQSLQKTPTIEDTVSSNVTGRERSFHKSFAIESLVSVETGLDERRTENGLKREESSYPAQRESFLNVPSLATGMDHLNTENEQMLEQVKKDLAFETESRVAVDSLSSVQSLQKIPSTEDNVNNQIEREEFFHKSFSIESLIPGNAGLDERRITENRLKREESNNSVQRESCLNVPSWATGMDHLNTETEQMLEQVKEDLVFDTGNRAAVDSIPSLQSLQEIPSIESAANNVAEGEDSFQKDFAIESLVSGNSGLDDRRETENELKSEESSNPAQRESFLNVLSSAKEMDHLTTGSEKMLEQVKEDLALDTESRVAVHSIISVQSLQKMPSIEGNAKNVAESEECFHKGFAIESLVPADSGQDDRREIENALKSEESDNPDQRGSCLNASCLEAGSKYSNTETKQVLQHVKEDPVLDTEKRVIEDVNPSVQSLHQTHSREGHVDVAFKSHLLSDEKDKTEHSKENTSSNETLLLRLEEKDSTSLGEQNKLLETAPASLKQEMVDVDAVEKGFQASQDGLSSVLPVEVCHESVTTLPVSNEKAIGNSTQDVIPSSLQYNEALSAKGNVIDGREKLTIPGPQTPSQDKKESCPSSVKDKIKAFELAFSPAKVRKSSEQLLTSPGHEDSTREVAVFGEKHNESLTKKRYFDNTSNPISMQKPRKLQDMLIEIHLKSGESLEHTVKLSETEKGSKPFVGFCMKPLDETIIIPETKIEKTMQGGNYTAVSGTLDDKLCDKKLLKQDYAMDLLEKPLSESPSQGFLSEAVSGEVQKRTLRETNLIKQLIGGAIVGAGVVASGVLFLFASKRLNYHRPDSGKISRHHKHGKGRKTES